MNYRVLQHPTDVHCVVKHEGGQLRLNTETLKVLQEMSDPVILLCVIGEPSTGKTGIINGIFNHLMSLTSSEKPNCGGFLQPQNSVQNGPEIDCILTGTPAFVVENENTGQRVSILLLDVWMSNAVSEEVYVSLVNFCFQASSIRIVPLGVPVGRMSN